MAHSIKRCAALLLCALALAAGAAAQELQKVETVKDADGWRLTVDGMDFPIKGVVWAFTPVGENYAYDLWSKPDAFIEKMIDTDMTLIKKMGANTIRCFSMIPPRWVSYIYDRYGIYTMVNDLFGRYGLSVNGRWMAKTDYSDPEVRKVLLAQFAQTVAAYKDVRGVLCFMLGNESNYGLEWSSDAIENLPSGERLEAKARFLYSLFGEAIAMGKTMDANHPIGIVNGDTQYLNIIKKECSNLDILGVNSYRGKKAFDLFYSGIAATLDRPVVYTEIGADAFNSAMSQEDQVSQAEFIKAQWEEMYLQSYGKGKSKNLLGAYVFEWVDEWWKHGMETGLSVHDTEGTWSNGAYDFDAVPGRNNMQEEWFGLAGQSIVTQDGINRRLLRASYYVLQRVWQLDMYTSTSKEVTNHFAGINVPSMALMGVVQGLGNRFDEGKLLGLRGSVDVRGYASATDKSVVGAASGEFSLESLRANANAKHTETVQLGFDFKPTEWLKAGLDLRVFGGQFFPDSQTKVSFLPPPAASARSNKDQTPIEIRSAYARFESEILDAELFLHNGHPDWYQRGDFFGLLPESFDIYSMDLEGSRAPFGVELRPKGFLDGLIVYAGPELYWGGFPMLMASYYRSLPVPGAGAVNIGALYQVELSYPDNFQMVGKTDVEAKKARPLTQAASLYLEGNFLPAFKIQLGGLLSRPETIGKTYDYVTDTTSLYNDANLLKTGTIDVLDCLAGKVRLSTDIIPYFQLFAQGSLAGAVADGKDMLPRNGSQLADIGVGNHWDVTAGGLLTVGPFSLAPKFVYREPLKQPQRDIAAGTYDAITPHDYLDIFYVSANRKAIQGEIVLGWDPTGATYLFDWNNDDREEAAIAASVSFLYNFYLGSTDALSYTSGNGAKYVWAKGGTTPDGILLKSGGLAAVSNTWSAMARVVGQPLPGFRFILTGTAGQGQSSSVPDPDLTFYYGGTLRMAIDRLMVEGGLLVDGWGPENWYREFNLTYPLQWNAGLSWGLSPLSFMSQDNRIGLKVYGQNLGSFSYPNNGVSVAADKLKNRVELQAYLNLTF